MDSCCAIIADHFNNKVAESDLSRYRRKGPGRTTSALRDFVLHAGGGKTLLDVGGGIGALSFELLHAGFEYATIVDSAPAYLAAARREVARQGMTDRATVIEGDFAAAGIELPAADAVVMDRVVCCYPSFQPLVEEALRHSRRLFGLSHPRDLWYVRFFVSLRNLMLKFNHSDFRMFVHPASAMHAIAERHNFRCVDRKRTPLWSIRIYVKSDAAP